MSNCPIISQLNGLGNRRTAPKGLYQIFEGGNILPFRMVYANIIRPKEYTFFLHNLVEGKRLSVNCWSWSFWQSLQASWSPSSTSLPLFLPAKEDTNLGSLCDLVHTVMRQIFAYTVQLNLTQDLTPCLT